MSNNRAITLEGAQTIFSEIDVEIERHELGYYFAEFDGNRIEEKTLTRLCQRLLTDLLEYKHAFDGQH